MEKIKTFLVELCCVYTIVSISGAIINIIGGTETSNLNVIVMFVTCAIATFVLYLHRLFDNVSPLVMMIVQYLVACILCGLFILFISTFVDKVEPGGWFEFYRSFTVPYVILAAVYYYRVFAETKEQDDMLREIQEKRKV